MSVIQLTILFLLPCVCDCGRDLAVSPCLNGGYFFLRFAPRLSMSCGESLFTHVAQTQPSYPSYLSYHGDSPLTALTRRGVYKPPLSPSSSFFLLLFFFSFPSSQFTHFYALRCGSKILS